MICDIKTTMFSIIRYLPYSFPVMFIISQNCRIISSFYTKFFSLGVHIFCIPTRCTMDYLLKFYIRDILLNSWFYSFLNMYQKSMPVSVCVVWNFDLWYSLSCTQAWLMFGIILYKHTCHALWELGQSIIDFWFGYTEDLD